MYEIQEKDGAKNWYFQYHNQIYIKFIHHHLHLTAEVSIP